MVHKDLLKIIVEPGTLAPLVLTADGNLLTTDGSSRRLYPVVEGIPVLLIEEARVLTPEEHHAELEKASQLPANNQAKKAARS